MTLVYLAMIYTRRTLFSDTAPLENVYLGEKAQKRIMLLSTDQDGVRDSLSPSKDHYLYDSGSVHGTIRYWAFTCGTQEECWKALKIMGAPAREDFIPWKPSGLAITMEGPGFYDPILKTDLWDVTVIKKGFIYEMRQGKNKNNRLVYYAIDTDKNRGYHHYESGGFPVDKWTPP